MPKRDADVRARLQSAIEQDDFDLLDPILRDQPDEARAALNAPAKWEPPLLAMARSIDTARMLLDHGAELGCVSRWWAPGFNVIANVDPEVGGHLFEAGADITPHAAAAIGRLDVLKALIESDPTVVDAQGGDGCTPLHFARTVETAALLLDHGADIDARDDDHDSTPAQWLIGDVPEVAAFLVSRGATPDIFLAAGLGDAEGARRGESGFPPR